MESPEYKQAEELWKSFRNKVFFKQRFFLSHPVLDKLATIVKSLEMTIAPGKIYYRARIIDDKAIMEQMLGKCQGLRKKMEKGFLVRPIGLRIYPKRAHMCRRPPS